MKRRDKGRTPEPKITAPVLAAAFVAKLQSWLTAKQWAKMLKLNATHPGRNAEHEFCDANMAMLGAWCDLSGEPENDVDLELRCGLFNAAWDIANDSLKGNGNGKA